MEKKEKKNLYLFTSLVAEVEGEGPDEAGYGAQSLVINAALAMFFTSPLERRMRWKDAVLAAWHRSKDDTSVLTLMMQFAGRSQDAGTAADVAPAVDVVQEKVQQRTSPKTKKA